ncbi:hypothetical protein D9M70_431890 [compost metagenome]
MELDIGGEGGRRDPCFAAIADGVERRADRDAVSVGERVRRIERKRTGKDA